MMLFYQLAAAFALVSPAMAQNFSIAMPSSGSVLTAGDPFTMQIQQPVAQGVFQSVSIIIGLQRCGTGGCTATDGTIMGQILYADKFSPQRHEDEKPPYQNFTFNLPDTEPGAGFLHASQMFLVGAGPTPQIATASTSVTINGVTGNNVRFRRET